MAARRKDDSPIGPSRYRSERVIQDGGAWFFVTREGSLEGPFSCRADAVNRLEVYVRLAVNDMLTQETSLSLQD